MKREPPTERQAWLETLKTWDEAHDELVRQLAVLAQQVQDEEDRRGE